MNRINDEFDKFLMDKAKDEKSQFDLPASLNMKIEETLKDVDKISHMKESRWYGYKKIMALAASFVFIISLGILRYSLRSNYNIEMARSTEEVSFESSEVYDSEQARGISEETYLNDLVDLKQVESIEINGKEIKDEEDISELLYLLNNMPLKTSGAEFINEDYQIDIKGEETHTIYMKENLLLINNVVYEGRTVGVDNLFKNIINN